MAAAPQSPRPLKAHRDGGDAPVSLFLDTDLGTHLAVLVAPDTTIRGLKLQVAAEHAAAFPDIGPVSVKSFQVRRKGVLYHLSDSMTLTSAFAKIKGGCFLHVKMEDAATPTHCCQDTSAINGRRLNDGHLGSHVKKCVQELPVMASDISRDMIPLCLEGGNDDATLNIAQAHDASPNCILVPSLSQLNTEINKKNTVGLASDTEAGFGQVVDKAKSYSGQIRNANQTEDAYISSAPMAHIGKSSKESNMPHIVDELHGGKDDILHGGQDHDVGASVSDKKQVRVEEQVLEEIHVKDNVSQEKEHEKSRIGSFDTSSRAVLETDTTTLGEPLNTSNEEVHETLHVESMQLENPSTVGKKKKRKRRQLAPSASASAQERAETSAGAADLPKSTGEVLQHNTLELQRNNVYAKDDLSQGKEHTKSMTGALDSSSRALLETDTTSLGEPLITSNHQEVHDPLHEDSIQLEDPSTVGKKTKRKRRQLAPSKSASAQETIEPSARAADLSKSRGDHAKGTCGPSDGENKYEEMKQHNEGSHDEGVPETCIMEKDGKSTDALDNGQTNKNTSQGTKRKKSKKVTVDMPSLDTAGQLQDTDAAPLDAKQTTPVIIEGPTVIQHKNLGEILDMSAKDVIDGVLADLRSEDNSSKELDGHLLTGQSHLGTNQNTLELPESTADKLGGTAALPPKYPAAVHSDAPVSSPRHKMSKGKKSKVLSTRTGTNSSNHLSGVPEEDATRELNEVDSLRIADKTSDPKDILTGDVVAQADDKPKATKRQRKKGSVKQVLGTLDLKEVNASKANLVQRGTAIDTPLSTVVKVEQEDMPSETLTPKIQETNWSTHGPDRHLAKKSQGEYVTDSIGTHDNENAAGTPTLHAVRKDAIVKSASPNAQNEKKKSLNSELQGQDSALGHGSSADLVNSRTENENGLISPKFFADAHIMAHPSSDEINFLDHFSCSKMNDDPPVSAENKQNNEAETLREVKNKKKNKRKKGTGSIEQSNVLEPLITTDKASLTGHFGTSKAIEPPIAAENMNRENENVKNSKEKKKRKVRANMEVSAAEKDDHNCYNQDTDIGTQDQETVVSVGQKGRMGQDNGKESNSKVTLNDSMMHHQPEDATRNHTLEKNLQPSVFDGQNKLLTDKDHVQISKDVRKSTSQTKSSTSQTKSNSKAIESMKGRVAPSPKPVRNLVKDFSMSPRASSDSTESTPQTANRFRVAVRKVPKQRYEQASAKSKIERRKLGSGAIFNDAISEGSEDELYSNSEKAVNEASPDNSSTSADSGISSAAYDESEVPGDDDDTVSLSQKSLKEGLHISSILRGSCSYKKVRQKQKELLDDDTIVPDSQPPTEDLWSYNMIKKSTDPPTF
ncbi:hypothetical protein U9M48_033003 [Paspalum notatum var. saurae]|uniref:Uncharacterized protein n=1 Tax=Paspalum notatum var. saurae TaxID=547442 RepID=A0AAQ3X544_PASNO